MLSLTEKDQADWELDLPVAMEDRTAIIGRILRGGRGGGRGGRRSSRRRRSSSRSSRSTSRSYSRGYGGGMIIMGGYGYAYGTRYSYGYYGDREDRSCAPIDKECIKEAAAR